MKQKIYWFRSIGVIWIPSTWKGWVVIVWFALLIILLFLRVDLSSQSVGDTFFRFIPRALLLLLLLASVCLLTGEPPAWAKGKKKS